tara:strand:- start:10942 stop:12177 length:1236 start_codon:yes stop_codon:yes gene_type:complete
MKGFNKKNNDLYVDEVPLSKIAEDYGTPAYIYSGSVIKDNFNKYSSCLRQKDLVCYAVKANPNISILKSLHEMGSGFDAVSANEIRRALLIDADPKKIVFSGVAKSIEELSFAIDSDILSINIESYSEMIRINEIALAKNKKVNCSIRLNPNISAKTHKYISTGLKTSKFGISENEIKEIAKNIKQLKGISLFGLSCHIGSQINDASLAIRVLERLKDCASKLKKLDLNITHLNLGGGLGIRYKDEIEISIENTINNLVKEIGKEYSLLLEPGRSIIGNAGVLLARVEIIKETDTSSFALIDAGMNDFIRPALYGAWHDILETEILPVKSKKYIVVGPVCESADVFGHERELSIQEGSLLAIKGAGAYGIAMSSNYNSRTQPPEIIVNKSKVKLIRRRESFEDMIKLEKEN